MKPFRSSLVLVGVALAVGCSNADQTASRSEKLSVAKTQAGTKLVELLTLGRLETGLVPIYLRVTEADGTPVEDVEVDFTPMMAMSNGKNHGCPVLGAPVFEAEDGLYHTAAVFQMPTSDMGRWSASVSLGSEPVEVGTFDELPVAESGRAQTFSYEDPATADVRRFVTSLNFDASPRVGLNPIVFTLHEMMDMTTFTPITNATLSLDPQMPSMGHGSPGSVDPVAAAEGRYEGQLSFSMAGTWETTITVNLDGTSMGSPKFTTTF